MPLTEKGEAIKSAMEKEYGKKKGEGVFYASANKGTITGVHNTSDVPEIGYRSSMPSGGSLQQMNESNHQFWAGSVGVGTNPGAAEDQGNNWTPGERKVAVGTEAMLTPPMQASRQDAPGENLFERSAGQEAGDADADLSLLPQVNKSNFNSGAGLAGRAQADSKEDGLMAKSAQGGGQNPHAYLQPSDASPLPAPSISNTNVYKPAQGTPPKPTEGPSIKEGASMAGARPGPSDTKEYKPVTKESLTDLNKRNSAFWEKNVPFNEGGED
jgi:hypothetical protein